MSTENRNADFTAANEIMEQFPLQYPGVDPEGIYCQFTGKFIGRTDTYEFLALCESITGDLESRCDDVAMRLFASMRPSMRWNKLRMESLDQLRKTHPVDTLAYCLNRLFTPLRYHGSTLALHHDRIRLYNRLVELESTDGGAKFIRDCLFVMIEVDAKLALATQTASFTAEDFISDSTDLAKLWDRIDNWHMARIEEIDLLRKRREMETAWFRDGNSLARQASISQFYESRPPSKRKVLEAAKAEDAGFMRHILRELMQPAEDAATPALDAVLAMPIPEHLPTRAPLPKVVKLSFLQKKG